MPLEIINEITNVQTIATGASIRDLARLCRIYGEGRWRKRKGIAVVRARDGRLRRAEVHWYEAHGVGTRELKVKRFLRSE